MRKLVGIVLALAVLSSAPAMALEMEMELTQQQGILGSVFTKLLWENWPHKDSVGIKWMNITHKMIAEECAKAMGIPSSYVAVLKEYSVAPDMEDQGWDRIYKHVYDPYLFGGWVEPQMRATRRCPAQFCMHLRANSQRPIRSLVELHTT